jgi:hypothetical protein
MESQALPQPNSTRDASATPLFPPYKVAHGSDRGEGGGGRGRARRWEGVGAKLSAREGIYIQTRPPAEDEVKYGHHPP